MLTTSKNALVLFALNAESDAVLKPLGPNHNGNKMFREALLHNLIANIKTPSAVEEFDFIFAHEAKRDRQQEEIKELADFSFDQQGPDFGSRFLNTLSQVATLGYRKIVIIGSDIPAINTAIIKNAFSALDQSDYVVGPDSSGGFYLVGFNCFQAGVFKNISWQSRKVLRQILQNLEEYAIEYRMLPKLTDIDSLRDLGSWINFSGKVSKILKKIAHKLLKHAEQFYFYFNTKILILQTKYFDKISWQNAPPLSIL